MGYAPCQMPALQQGEHVRRRYAPFILTFVAYTFTALEAIADELEDPFGNMPNDLALDALSANIERSISEIEDMHIDQTKPADSFYIT